MTRDYFVFGLIFIILFFCLPIVSQSGDPVSTLTFEETGTENIGSKIPLTVTDSEEGKHDVMQTEAHGNSSNNNDDDDKKVVLQFPQFPDDVMAKILSKLDPTSLNCARQVSRYFRHVANLKVVKDEVAAHAWPYWLKEHFPFEKIPGGYLPGNGPGGVGRRVEAFEVSRYPVTRGLWERVMGSVPISVPKAERADWSECPDYPMTYVAWEDSDSINGRIIPAEIQEFIVRLNRIELKYSKVSNSHCTYDLPTEDQLWYSIRGDVTGTNKDPYSAGVTDDNVNDYITHYGNAYGIIRPIGRKIRNKFGVELGNVWKLSKDIWDSRYPECGRSVRGGGYNCMCHDAVSGRRACQGCGWRDGYTGFSLVRTCQ